MQEISIKGKYNIYIKKESLSKLRNLVLPYFHTSMLYKLGLDNTDSSSFNPHTNI